MTVTVEDRYIATIQEMSDRARAWQEAHPDQVPAFNWQWPADVLVIATMDDVGAAGLVDLNEAATDMLAAMVEGIPRSQAPTPTMIRVAVQHARGAE